MSGLEADPGFEDAVGKDRRAVDPPARRADRVKLSAKHGRDGFAPFQRLDVPGERGEVAPKAFVAK